MNSAGGLLSAARRAAALAVASLALSLASAPFAVAQIAHRDVDELEGVGITEMPNAQIPPGAQFKDENGNRSEEHTS